MSIVIQSGPLSGASYSKANLRPFKVRCNGNLYVDVRMSNNSELLFSGSYLPGFDGCVEFDIKDVLESLLYAVFYIENDGAFSQINFSLPLIVYLTDDDDNEVVMFSVRNINANTYPTLPTAIKRSFLTIQPSVKKTTINSPEYLSYYFLSGQRVMVKFYRKNGTTETVSLFDTSSLSDVCFTIDVSFKRVVGFSSAWPNILQPYYDVFVVDASGNRISNTQRYQVVDETGREKYYIFANSLGGIDTLICSGDLTQNPEVEYGVGNFDGKLVQLDDSDDSVVYKQNSGYISRINEQWMRDFMMTKGLKYLFDPDTCKVKPIVITETNAEINDHNVFASFDFSYKVSDGDMMTFEPKPIAAQSLAITSKMVAAVEYEAPLRSIDIEWDDNKKRGETEAFECTSSNGIIIQVVANGYVSIFSSTDKDSWTLVETVLVNGSTIRQFDYAPLGSYWKVEADCRIEMIKTLI